MKIATCVVCGAEFVKTTSQVACGVFCKRVNRDLNAKQWRVVNRKRWLEIARTSARKARLTPDENSKALNRARALRWSRKHPQKNRDKAKAWKLANPERYAKRMASYREGMKPADWNNLASEVVKLKTATTKPTKKKTK